MADVKNYEPPKKLYRVSKYVFTRDLFMPGWSRAKGPTDYRTTAEMLERYPEQVSMQLVGADEPLPEFAYQYIGSDDFYTGQMAEKQIPATYLLAIKEGRSLGRHGAIIGPGNFALTEFDANARKLNNMPKSLPGGKLNPRYWKYHLKHSMFRTRLAPAQRCSGSVAVLNNAFPHNYYHWMVEILPRLATLQAAGIQPDWYLVDKCTSFQRKTLEAYGVPLEKVIQPHSTLHLQADELLVPSSWLADATRQVGQKFRNESSTIPMRSASPRIYIDRRNSRRVRNVEAFEKLLDRFGFENHFLEDYSIAEQSRLFDRAEIVLALHGAGLANSIFAQPGTSVVELMPEGKKRMCFPNLSRLMGLRHYLISAQRAGFHQDMTVPIDTLESALTQIAEPQLVSAAA